MRNTFWILPELPLVRPQFRFDTKYSKYEGQSFNIYGYDIGILVKNKMRITLGYNQTNTLLPDEKLLLDTVSTRTLLKMNSVSLNTELLYYSSRFISLGFPMDIAVGRYEVATVNAADNVSINSKKNFLVYTNFGLSLTFTPVRLIGLKAIIGYRKSIFPSEKDFNFNGVFTSVGLNIDVHEIRKDIKMYRLMKRNNHNFKGGITFVGSI